jgi:glycosyltransferase involved in cell wall biosynthesis
MQKNPECSPTSSDLVSVVIPMFNSVKWIRQTLVSVFHQDYECFEVLVVNDGSTDTSLRVVEQIASEYPGVDLQILNIPNSGVSFARNLGIKHSKGKYVALLDSDDIWYPEKLSLQVDFLEKNQNCIGVLCDFFVSFSEKNGTDLRNVRLISNTDSKSLGQNWLNLEGNGALLSSTALLKRTRIIDYVSFSSELSTTADLHFYLQLISKGEIGQVNLPLVQYRQHENQMHLNPNHLKKEIPLLLSKLESLNFPYDQNRILANVSVMCSVLNLHQHNYGTAALDFFQALRLRPLSSVQIPYKILKKRFFGVFLCVRWFLGCPSKNNGN